MGSPANFQNKVNPNLEKNYKGVFDNAIGFGEKPALVIVDFIRAYVQESAPLYAPMVVDAVQNTKKLLERARQEDIPVIFTRVLYNPNFLDGGLFVKKVPVLRNLTSMEPMAEIVDELPRKETDTVLVKQYASAFFGTSLAAMLTSLGVDTILLTGCSTSGCIRATAVDGMQHGFRVIIPEDCVGDRSVEPHIANLFDINSKYGDVVDSKAVFNYFEKRN